MDELLADTPSVRRSLLERGQLEEAEALQVQAELAGESAEDLIGYES